MPRAARTTPKRRKAAAPAPRRRRAPIVALVCAGGGVTGAVYEIGCLRALDDLLDRSVADLDFYVGVSGGAFVTSLLAAGITPAEMYEAATAEGAAGLGVGDAPLYRLGLADLLHSAVRAPRVLQQALRSVFGSDRRTLADIAWSFLEVLPAGLLDNSGVQEYVAALLASRGRADRFADLRRPLFVVAVDLDSGEAVAFGDDQHAKTPVSQAVQASTALPGLYRPVRIDGRDYVDGGVKKTAHIHLAIEKGARLVLCVNPIVPIRNDTLRGAFGGHLSSKGITYVLDQVLRIALHGRMQYGMDRYRREHPKVDILLLEPTRDDVRMFSYNIMRYDARRIVAEHGYRSVLHHFKEHYHEYRPLLKRHGITLRHPDTLPVRPPVTRHRSAVGRSLAASLRALQAALDARSA